MKLNENIKLENVESVLRNKYDLGFLLDQINNKESKDNYFLPVTDVLRLFPEYMEAVKVIRDRLKINPVEVRNELSSLIGEVMFSNYLKTSIQIARGIHFPFPNNEWGDISNKIKDWKYKTYPQLSNLVGEVRLKNLGNLPHSLQDDIENYILFEEIRPTSLVYRRPVPEISVKRDPSSLDHYLEIRIYADTDVRRLPSVNDLRKFQKNLPGYYNPQKWDEEILLTRFLIYVLSTKLKLTQNKITTWLKNNKYRYVPDYEHISQEKNRFERIFKTLLNQ
jgi:hypothetical protein